MLTLKHLYGSASKEFIEFQAAYSLFGADELKLSKKVIPIFVRPKIFYSLLYFNPWDAGFDFESA